LEQARAYRQLGQTGEASKLYDQVIDEHGGTRFAERARSEQQQL
jgi:TolA-binding protein